MASPNSRGPLAAGAANRPCLLVNPRSFRASWLGYARRATHLAQAAGVEVQQVVDPATLRTALDGLRQRRQQQIWVLAGDGTIHAMAEYLAAPGHDDWSPAMLFLAGGRANIVPRECGGFPAMPALRRALAALREGRSLREGRILTLQVSQAGRPARHGFVFASAIVSEAQRRLAEHRARGTGWFHRSFFSEPYVLLKMAVEAFILRRPLPHPEVVARLAGVGELTAPMRVLLASTMELQGALYNPFAARGTGPVRLTALAANAPGIRRRIVSIIRGQFSDEMNVTNGILSGRGERAELQGITAYALDGELFEADPALPLVFTPGVGLRVLHA